MFVELKAVVQEKDMHFYLHSIQTLGHKVVLMDGTAHLNASLAVSWFIDEIKPELSYVIFACELLSAVIDAVVMIVPDSDYLRCLLELSVVFCVFS